MTASAKCMTCARFEVAGFAARTRLERHLRFRHPKVGDAKYAEQAAALKNAIAVNQALWDQHRQDAHPDSSLVPSGGVA